MPQFSRVLEVSQQRILKNVIQLKLPLSIFFISLKDDQLPEFEKVHNQIKDRVERHRLLISVSKASKPMSGKHTYETLDQAFTFKIDILKTIDEVQIMKPFFYLSELPDAFTEHFSIEQIVRYGKVIELVTKCAQEEMDAERADRAGQPQISAKQRARDLESALLEVKRLMIKFISCMDVHEVYEFVNHFPFLVDPEALRSRIEAEAAHAEKY